jgi:hypothetical protein
MFFIATTEFLCADTCTPSVPIFFPSIRMDTDGRNTYYIHTYKLYLFTLVSTTLQADFHEGRDLELFTG